MTRREVLRSLTAAATTSVSGAAAPVNVLFLMADQFRHDAMSCAGNPVVHTPNLDRLAAEGVRFTDAVCAAPLCGPSRASLLTGQYAHGHGCYGNYEMDQPGMSEEARTWDERLAAHGYVVEYHGKWHVGSANRSCYRGGLGDYLELYHEYLRERYPERRKRPGEAVDRYSKWPYRPVAADRMMLESLKQKLVMPHHNEAGEHAAPAGDSLTAWTAGRVVRFLESKPKQPFSVTCSILHPHAPLVAAQPFFGMYDPAKMPMPKVMDDVFTPPEKRAIPKVLTLTPEGLGTYISLYYGLVNEVDDWVGRILGALDNAGLAGNTLVVFLSDHGDMLGEHSRVSKMVFYEASVRVPLLMRLPGRIPKGRTVQVPATGADVAPTILDYCGLGRAPEMHGRSLRAAIENGRPPFEFAYTELHPPDGRPEEQRILRSREWKFAFLSGRPYLYNLSEDPEETRNLLEPRHRRERWVSQARMLQKAMLTRLEEMRSTELDRIRALTV